MFLEKGLKKKRTMCDSSWSFLYYLQLFSSGLKLHTSQQNKSPARSTTTNNKFNLLIAYTYLVIIQYIIHVPLGSCLHGL